MIYKFLRWYTRWGIKFFFRNVFIYHKRKLDFNKGAIIASNHPAGFYESIILTTILPKPINFLVRSDYVNIKLLKKFFKIIKLLPIYRQSEGLQDIKKNKEVFDIVSSELKENAFIGVYPEGSTKYQFKISVIKKGIARIIKTALDYSNNSVRVIPIGFNFSNLTNFRSFLNIYSDGQLYFSNEDLTADNINVDLRKITKNIEYNLKLVNINLDDLNKQKIFGKLQCLLINNEVVNKKNHSYEMSSSLPERLVNLSREINKMDEIKFEELNMLLLNYFNKLKESKINDRAVISNQVNWINILSLVFGFPIFILGVLLNILPILPGIFIVKKFTKEIEYKTVLLALISQVLYLIYFVFILIFSLKLFGAKGLISVILPFLAWYSVKYFDLLSDVFYSLKMNFIKDKKMIVDSRNTILNHLPVVFH